MCATLSCPRKQKCLEIWRYAVILPCEPCLARLGLSPSLSPKYTFSWRQIWRYTASARCRFGRLANIPRRLERPLAQRNPRPPALLAARQSPCCMTSQRYFSSDVLEASIDEEHGVNVKMIFARPSVLGKNILWGDEWPR